jgi:hypothetical protein
MEQDLKEGQYLTAGVKETPIPFTQDPTLKAGKEDLEKDSEILKGGELREQDSSEDTEATGKKDKKGSINKKFAGSAGSSDGGDVMESYNEFKVGDTVCINNIKNKEWIIESIQGGETPKFALRSGLRRTIINPSEIIVEHIEGVEIHRERFEDSVNELRRIYENMEAPVEEVKEELAVPPELMPQEKPVMEKKELYNTIKGKGLHDCGDRGMALQQIGEMCGNSMEEIHSVYEDACLSVRNPNIDETYGYSECEYNENNAGLMSDLTTAYEEMQKKEIEETAKKTDEEGHRAGGGTGGGLNPISLGF